MPALAPAGGTLKHECAISKVEGQTVFIQFLFRFVLYTHAHWCRPCSGGAHSPIQSVSSQCLTVYLTATIDQTHINIQRAHTLAHNRSLTRAYTPNSYYWLSWPVRIAVRVQFLPLPPLSVANFPKKPTKRTYTPIYIHNENVSFRMKNKTIKRGARKKNMNNLDAAAVQFFDLVFSCCRCSVDVCCCVVGLFSGTSEFRM